MPTPEQTAKITILAFDISYQQASYKKKFWRAKKHTQTIQNPSGKWNIYQEHHLKVTCNDSTVFICALEITLG